MKLKDIAIYIHIPFCISKCYYCDFLSFPRLDGSVDSYIDYLMREMDLYRESLKEYTVKTIFIGGGTPSYIGEKYIYRLLNHIYKNFNCNGLEEITIESNPGTLSREKLRIYKEVGVNRISMGVQSLDDRLLREIGRAHSSKDFYNSYELVRDMGFENVNVDLMFGLPNQTWKDCEGTLEKAIQLDVEHISYYGLILEENTLMNKWYHEGKIQIPEEDLERAMYHRGIELLEDNGYSHYEISNFSKEGLECKHNLFYWELRPYIGLGLSSHSNLNHKRFWNYNDFTRYYDSLDKKELPIEGEEKIDKRMEVAEYLIMGLRLIDGINRKEFFNRFCMEIEDVYGEVLKKYEAQGLLDIDTENIKFTPKGLDLSNIVYVELLPE